MPELPEVESLRRTLEPRLLGRKLLSVRVHRRDVITGSSAPAALLARDTIVSMTRRGKQLAVHGQSGRCLIVHLGMTGQVLITSAIEAPRLSHIHVAWSLDTPSSSGGDQLVVFRDPRRFGGIWTLPSPTALEERWTDLGPDALTITAESLRAGLRSSRRAIKAALLDQRVLAGVGNIYADEALFAAGIAPGTSAHRVTPSELHRLAAALRRTLQASITAGGSTLRDFVDAQGNPGDYRKSHLVYGRAKQPCVRCGTVLRTRLLAQRTTVWCPSCQSHRRGR
jgi:formamidopyrimidine-DNA glycosylase